MVRSTFSHRRAAVSGKRTTVLMAALLSVATLLASIPALAVTHAQLNATQTQIQTLSQTIKTSESRTSSLEGEVQSLDRQILNTRRQLREERLAGRKQLFDARRELKLQEFEINRIQKDIAVVDVDLDVLERTAERDRVRFDSLNLIKKGLEEGDFRKRQADYERQRTTLHERRAALQAELEAASAQHKSLQDTVSAIENEVEDAALDKDPRLAALLQKRERAASELTSLRSQLRNDRNQLSRLQEQLRQQTAQFQREQQAQQARAASAAKPVAIPVAATPAPQVAAATPAPAAVLLDRTDYSSYVFVISGDQEPDIEQTLLLKSWVESYGAKYIQTRWNGVTEGKGPQSTAGFRDAFRSYLRQIPRDAKLILIGHGLGGGAAIEAATEVAYAESRTIDFLAALDPIGDRNLRANIVYDTGGICSRPDPKDEMTNTDYVECIKSAKKRMITSNIRFFYNRWQKDAQGPLDYQRAIPSLDGNGKVVYVPTATGRFDVAENTGADQKRLFFGGNKDAHRLLLAEEAKQLPKLLVQHLR